MTNAKISSDTGSATVGQPEKTCDPSSDKSMTGMILKADYVFSTITRRSDVAESNIRAANQIVLFT